MMEQKFNLNFANLQELNSIYLIYRLAANLNDYLQKQSTFDGSRLYWSTTFVQAHFACEIACGIHWPTLHKKGFIEPWPQEMDQSVSPLEKMRTALDFSYTVFGGEAVSMFHGLLVKQCEKSRNPLEALNTYDLAPTMQYQANFAERFLKVYNDQSISADEHIILVYKMIRYIYSVRDHFFQGLSLISRPLDENIQLRFETYSNVLLVFCEFLYSAVEHISNWSHKDVILANQNRYNYFGNVIETSNLRNRYKRKKS